MRTRILYLLAIFIAVFLFLIYKLFYLQIFNNKSMLEKVSSQRFMAVPVNNLRGTICDRNFIPLTDNDKKTHLIIVPHLIENQKTAAEIVAQYCGISYESILKNIETKNPVEYIVDYDKAISIKEKVSKGVIVASTSSRYGTSSIARHVIGYINSDNTGQYGIEKGYNPLLKRNGHQYVGILRDVFSRPLTGMGYRVAETYSEETKKNVKLTLDYHFQKIIEEAFDHYAYNGAAVLLDTQNGDILAMVSRPNYEQNDISKYFYSSNKELINKALYPYNLGSIFKIVVAEAALEEGIVKEDDTFFCPGYIVVDGQVKKCASYNAGGHGHISFTSAFSESCNTIFVDVGLKLGYKKIIESARKFGLGQSLGLDVHGLAEDPGFVPYKKYVSNREIANVSIGQGEILVTPLQVANLIVIVANDGVKKQINIVDSIVDDEGNVIKNVKDLSEERVVSKNIIQKIKSMMCEVTKSGTGIMANAGEYGGAAGKTSSAETGIYEEEEQIIHAWFGGYFPESNPKYALAIIIENGKTGSQVAAPLFGEIASKILSIER